jgi:hypothetical protein
MIRARQILKGLKIAVIVIVSIIVMFLVTAIFISTIYGDKINQILINQINKNINAKVSTSTSKFWILKYFPSATITFYDVTISSQNESEVFNSKPLFKAKELSIRFNLMTLIKGKYEIIGIVVKTCNTNIVIAKNGKVNYQIWKENDILKDKVEIRIRNILLYNTIINYYNLNSDQEINIEIEKLRINGDFIDEPMDFKYTSLLSNISYSTKNMKNSIRKKILISSIISSSNRSYIIDRGKFEIDNQLFNFSGQVEKTPKTGFEFELSSRRVNILTLAAIVKFELPKYLEFNKLEIDFKTKISGKINESTSLSVLGTANLIVADINFKNISNIHFDKGAINYVLVPFKEQYKIEINNLLGNVYNSKLLISAKSSNINEYRTEVTGNIISKVTDLNRWLENKPIKFIDGAISADFNVSTNRNLNGIEFKDLVYTGKLFIDSVSLKYNDYDVRRFTSNVEFNRNEININNLRSDINDNLIEIKGKITNGLQSYLDSTVMPSFQVDINSNSIDLEKFVSKSKSTLNLNSVTISFSAKELKYRNFNWHNFHSKILICKNSIDCQDIKFEGFGGKFRSTTFHYFNSLKNSMELEARFIDLDAKLIFKSFQNFGQSKVVSENINGKLSGNIQFSCELDQNNKVIFPSIVSNTDITINDGKLTNLEFVNRIFKYVNVKKQDHLVFGPIQEKIKILNNSIFFDPLDLKTNAIDFSITGTHSFENEYDYHLRFNAMDIMNRNKSTKVYDELGLELENDTSRKLNVFLRVNGKGTDYTIGLDNKQVVKSFVKKLSEEKKILKSLIKQELGIEKIHDREKSTDKTVKIQSEEFKPSNKQNDKKIGRKKDQQSLEWKDE